LQSDTTAGQGRIFTSEIEKTGNGYSTIKFDADAAEKLLKTVRHLPVRSDTSIPHVTLNRKAQTI
jgi:hypothetical protein